MQHRFVECVKLGDALPESVAVLWLAQSAYNGEVAILHRVVTAKRVSGGCMEEAPR